MKNVSTGFGLCIVGLGIAAWPVLDRLMPHASAVGVGLAAPAVAAATLAQDPPAPTIVWYDTEVTDWGSIFVFRAWSNGRIEGRYGAMACGANGNSWVNSCGSNYPNSHTSWFVIADPAQGLTFDADLNFDEAVNGDDLGLLLARWGPAPRSPVPPSDCPLALISP